MVDKREAEAEGLEVPWKYENIKLGKLIAQTKRQKKKIVHVTEEQMEADEDHLPSWRDEY